MNPLDPGNQIFRKLPGHLEKHFNLFLKLELQKALNNCLKWTKNGLKESLDNLNKSDTVSMGSLLVPRSLITGDMVEIFGDSDEGENLDDEEPNFNSYETNALESKVVTKQSQPKKRARTSQVNAPNACKPVGDCSIDSVISQTMEFKHTKRQKSYPLCRSCLMAGCPGGTGRGSCTAKRPMKATVLVANVSNNVMKSLICPIASTDHESPRVCCYLNDEVMDQSFQYFFNFTVSCGLQNVAIGNSFIFQKLESSFRRNTGSAQDQLNKDNQNGNAKNKKKRDGISGALTGLDNQTIKLFIPVFVNRNHWCLCMINYLEKTIVLMNPMSCVPVQENVEGAIRLFKPNCSDVSLEDFTFVVKTDVPQQTNSYDCGVFVLSYLEALAFDKPFCVYQSHMNDFRMALLTNFRSQSWLPSAHLISTIRASNLNHQ